MALEGPQIDVLLLLSQPAPFNTSLVGMTCEVGVIDQQLTPFRSKRLLYSVRRLELTHWYDDGCTSHLFA
ncbi:MAG: hypothetical protein ABI767_03365 [Rhodanobacter sp.]